MNWSILPEISAFLNNIICLTGRPCRIISFPTAFQYLKKNGFQNNLYNHLSKGRDNNLYFTCLPGKKSARDWNHRGRVLRRLSVPARELSAVYPGFRSAKKPDWQVVLRRTPVEEAYVRLETELRSGCPDPLIFWKYSEKTRRSDYSPAGLICGGYQSILNRRNAACYRTGPGLSGVCCLICCQRFKRYTGDLLQTFSENDRRASSRTNSRS